MTTDTINQTQADESLDEMMSAGSDGRDKNYFGLISTIDDWDCALVRGAGKVPFDPAVHTYRNVALKIEILCTKADGSPYALIQEDITSGSKHKVTLKSLTALGVQTRSQLRGLKNKYAQVTKVKTGGKYQSKVDATDGSFKKGDWRDEEALKFVALFDTLEAATAAQEAFYTPRNGQSQTSQAPARNVPQPIEADIDQAARAQYLGTLPILWQMAKQDLPAFLKLIADNEQFAKLGIERHSPEVTAITGEIPF